jgi:hypothetical protein
MWREVGSGLGANTRQQQRLRARAAAQLLQGLPLREGRSGCAGEGSVDCVDCARGSSCAGERDGSGSGRV